MTARIVHLTTVAHVDSDLPDDLLVSQLRIRIGEGLGDQAGVQRWHTEGAVTDGEQPS